MIAAVPAIPAGFVGFVCTSGIWNDIDAKLRAGAIMALIIFVMLFFPLTLRYGISKDSPWKKPYEGNLMKIVLRFVRIE